MTGKTHIFDRFGGEAVSVDFLIKDIENCHCDPIYDYCDQPATYWAVYESGIWPVCSKHGRLGSGQGRDHIKALIGREGLTVAEGDSIDDVMRGPEE